MITTETLNFCAHSLSSDYFSVHIQKKDIQYIFSNYADSWVSYYKKNSLWTSDPAVQETLNNQNYLFWGEQRNVESPKIVLEARDYNIRSGVSRTIQINEYQYCTVTLSSHDESTKFKKGLTFIALQQAMRYGILLSNISMMKNEEESRNYAGLLFLEHEMYLEAKKRETKTLEALATLRSEIFNTTSSYFLDQQNFLLKYTKKTITDLDQT